MKTILKLIFICNMLAAMLYAQNTSNTNPLDFFPYHIGDVWQYYSVPEGEFLEMKITRIDSSEDGKWHFLFYNNNTYATYKINLDSALVYAYLVNSAEWFLYFKLDTYEGDWWTKYSNDIWAQYAGEKSEERWGQTLSLKNYYQYDTVPPDTVPPFVGFAEYLASGIGFYGSEWEGGNDVLLGCIVDGVKFGNVVGINKDILDSRLSNYSLHQNFPNPFNNGCVIKYSIPEQSQVELKVFDVLGREVAELLNKEQPAGSYDVQFDASDLGSGVYFYQIRAGQYVESKKMILLK